jgi:hypothetical protein
MNLFEKEPDMDEERRRESLAALARLDAEQTKLRTDVMARFDRLDESLAAIIDKIQSRPLGPGC